ncbi:MULTISPECIES: hypothetical protein [Kitasatospora]|uniref:Integral membrane protein n=1 Tax=Kitasatospora setae (strain ATCC 33774 / DSM 43861 / JCM 3304 / KCC A-0304 / NBRC 14216 / KM-6054) TaxID=452652 RepID=E4NEV7_KITSK|nr:MULTISPECIES: hypothetical protein [Kitasatospora]BAJ29893.1 hypothetical protein KSE_41040 [Kitasatospora setae KM-6054]
MTEPTAAARRGAAVPAVRMPVAAWDLRLLRAVPFALVCTLVAAFGHARAGGAVAPEVLLPGFAAVCAAAALAGGRERSLAAIAAALAGGQVGLHLLFHYLGGGLFGAAPMAHAGMAGNGSTASVDPLAVVAGRLLCDDAPGNGLTVVPLDTTPEQVVSAAGLDPQAVVAAAAPHASAWLGLTPAMLLGHLAAALVAGWWLRRGEAALWRLLRAVALTAREWAAPVRTAVALLTALLLGTGRPVAAARRAGRPEDWPLPAAAALRHSVLRRGPPVAAFAR